MKRRVLLSLIVLGLLLPTAASRTIQSNSNVVVPASAVTIPFELVNKHVVIQVKVNNSRPVSFVLDTGGQLSSLDITPSGCHRSRASYRSFRQRLIVNYPRPGRMLPADEYRLPGPKPGDAIWT